MGSGASVLVSAHDAERMIESLKQMELLDVGTVKWMDQHSYIEKLNLQVIKEGGATRTRRAPLPPAVFSFLSLSLTFLPFLFPTLHLQAHYNAQTHSDEFVVEGFCSFDKINHLIRSVLVMEVWKEKLLPLLRTHIAEKVDSVTSYQLLFHEAACANLLEVLLFHRHAFSAVDEDHLVELIDWCYRKIIYLNNEGHKDK